jgi:hypothetical protein
MAETNESPKIKFNKKDIDKGLTLPKQVSAELAYLCGILVGDGSIYGRKEKHEYLIKCVGNPKDEQELYYKIIGPRFKSVFGFIPKIKYHDSATTFGFALYSKNLYKYLTKDIGLLEGRKDERLGIPGIFKENKQLIIPFIRGVFDTDGCITFKKRYSEKPYYPVITLASKSKKLVQEIAEVLKNLDLKVVEIYDYKLIDQRIKAGSTIINRIELNGTHNLKKWLENIGFESPKHLLKIQKHWEEQ